MASDIVPIQLSLTAGDLVTLWAPRWREDGEEWEAFLGDDDALFAFPEVAQLAAFVRTAPEHDLTDHPAWSVVPDLTVAELTPQDTQRYDIVGVPELVAEDPDTWTIGELAEITDMVRSIADVCELDAVLEVLGAAPGFALLRQGTLPFAGREGAAAVDPAGRDDRRALGRGHRRARRPGHHPRGRRGGAGRGREGGRRRRRGRRRATVTEADEDGDVDEEDEEPGFWEDVGIDPIRITTRDGDVVTLRCYLDDAPVFLGSDGRIDVFRTSARWPAGSPRTAPTGTTWPPRPPGRRSSSSRGRRARACEVDDLNTYTLTGLADDIAEGTLSVDPAQLELATELLLDVGDWAGDDEAREALAESAALGWLVSFIIKPGPDPAGPEPAVRRRERPLPRAGRRPHGTLPHALTCPPGSDQSLRTLTSFSNLVKSATSMVTRVSTPCTSIVATMFASCTCFPVQLMSSSSVRRRTLTFSLSSSRRIRPHSARTLATRVRLAQAEPVPFLAPRGERQVLPQNLPRGVERRSTRRPLVQRLARPRVLHAPGVGGSEENVCVEDDAVSDLRRHRCPPAATSYSWTFAP